MADYHCPGVYVEEDASLSLSIASGATAVPVFAHDGALLDASNPIRIDSWLTFDNLKKKKTDKDQLIQDKLYLSLKTYFDNGGGYCYVCKTDSLLTAVPGLDDVTLIVAAGQTIGSDTVTILCDDGKSRFAILDGPALSEVTGSKTPGEVMKDYPSTAHAAVYFPSLNANWAKAEKTQGNPSDGYYFYDIPISAAVAGAYCTVDRERGVWKAPANVALKGGVWPTVNVSDDKQGDYNIAPKPLNMIRVFRTGTDPLIWGARTLTGGDDNPDLRWRYVPVRRLFNIAEKDIKRAMAFAVFEPNSQPTWERVRAAIDAYLHSIWKQGGLMGNKPEEAYFVQVGLGLTMTQQDIDEGRMIVKIGMAAVRPAEFIILKFTQDMGAT